MLVARPHRGMVRRAAQGELRRLVRRDAGIHVLVYALPAAAPASDLRRAGYRRRGSRSAAVGRRRSRRASALAVVHAIPLARPWLHFHGPVEGAPRAPTVAAPTPLARPRSDRIAARVPSPALARALGLPPVPPGPGPGLRADRRPQREQAADRLAVEADRLAVPAPGRPAPRPVVRRPGRRVLRPGYRRIVTNEEFNDRWRRSTSARTGSSGATAAPASRARPRGELSNPDDAYVWPNGTITVADIKNCRVVRLDPARPHHRARSAAPGCTHDPPRALALARTAPRRSPTAACSSPRSAAGSTGSTAQRPARLHGPHADHLSVGRAAAPERQHPRRRLQHARPRRRDHAAADGSSGRTAPHRARARSTALARGPLAERDDRRHRRLAPPDRRHRPADEADRLAVRPLRRRLGRAGLPLKPDGLDLLPASDVGPRRPPARLRSSRAVGSARLPPASAARRGRASRTAGVLVAGGLVGRRRRPARSCSARPGAAVVGTLPGRRRTTRRRPSSAAAALPLRRRRRRSRPTRSSAIDPRTGARSARRHARRAALRPRRRRRRRTAPTSSAATPARGTRPRSSASGRRRPDARRAAARRPPLRGRRRARRERSTSPAA